MAGQKNRFLGIVIGRERSGLRHNFTVRNVIDGMGSSPPFPAPSEREQGLSIGGVEVMFELYNPLIQKIEVIRLEKWLDEDLAYLKDCREEFSTFPLDLHPSPHPPGAPVPVNTNKVAPAH